MPEEHIAPKKEIENPLLIIVAVAFFALLGMTYSYSLAADEFDNVSALASKPLGEAFYKKLHWEMVTPHAPWPKRDSHFAYVFNGKLFMTGGLDADDTFVGDKPVYEKATYYNDVWVTEDGKEWKKITDHNNLPPLRSMSVVEFKGKLIGIGGWGPETGGNQNIYESTDGVNWSVLATNLPFPTREGMRALVANNKIYFFGGVNYDIRQTYNDVWVSDDGVTWKELTAHAAWSSRWDDDVVYYKGKFWLAGGMNLNLDGFSDVWYSEDGVEWYKAVDNGPFGERQGLILVNYKNALYMIGGLEAKSNLGKNEVWFSVDGFDWVKTDEDVLWPAREDAEVIEFKDKLFMFGGMSTRWHWKNDIWSAMLP